jgi:hypothetical protein
MVEALATTSEIMARMPVTYTKFFGSAIFRAETRNVPSFEEAKPSGLDATERNGKTEATPPNCKIATRIMLTTTVTNLRFPNGRTTLRILPRNSPPLENVDITRD